MNTLEYAWKAWKFDNHFHDGWTEAKRLRIFLAQAMKDKKMIDCVELEMAMAQIMAIQEASGFRFDRDAAERVRTLSTKKSKRYKQPSSSAIAGCLARCLHPSVQTKRMGTSRAHL